MDWTAAVDHLRDAMNRHDLDAMVESLHEDYRSEQPAHPDRGFGGREQVRKNYALLFVEVPDLRAEILRSAAAGDEVWSEWLMHGTKTDGGRFEYRGAAIFGIRDDRIAWARFYFEPAEPDGEGIDAATKSLVEKRGV